MAGYRQTTQVQPHAGEMLCPTCGQHTVVSRSVTTFTPTMYRCPIGAFRRRSQRFICGNCAANFRLGQIAPRLTPMSLPMHCGRCSGAVDPAAAYCPSCGLARTPSQPEQKTLAAWRMVDKRNPLPVMAALLACVCVPSLIVYMQASAHPQRRTFAQAEEILSIPARRDMQAAQAASLVGPMFGSPTALAGPLPLPRSALPATHVPATNVPATHMVATHMAAAHVPVAQSPATPSAARPSPVTPTATADGAAAERPARTPMLGSRSDGSPFEKRRDDCESIVGFEIATARWDGKTIVRTLEPVYASDDLLPTEHTILARSGYAVGGLCLNGDGHVTALKVIFLRIGQHGLDPKDSYQTRWIGSPTDTTTYVMAANGDRVVGIYGRKGLNVDALGLLLMEPTSKR